MFGCLILDEWSSVLGGCGRFGLRLVALFVEVSFGCFLVVE